VNAKQIVESLLSESDPVKTVDIDGYRVDIFEDPEKPGFFYSTVNYTRYSGPSKRTPELAVERAQKTVEIRKQVDAEQKAQSLKPRQDNSVIDFFDPKKNPGIKDW
jgi:hypothetical protein